MTENKVSKYLLYALGEIVLVVIGILVALYINNMNDLRKERVRELGYLDNIKTDLKLNIKEMDKFLAVRNNNIQSAAKILEHFDGKPIEDYTAFNQLGVGIYNWQKFYTSNNTFQELVNSGNLAIISNVKIKNQLLDIEALYKKMKSEEDHYRFDTEKLIYEPLYEMMDLNPLVQNFAFKISKGQSGKDVVLTGQYYDAYLKSIKLKNGFVMTILELETMNGQMQQLKAQSEALIVSIDDEMKTVK
ncbi:MAG: hypothetical protein KA902_06835 [Arenimonas sp.]|nr:hypothetical protein [Arenimonas sp.]